jgi:hypothetical protein
MKMKFSSPLRRVLLGCALMAVFAAGAIVGQNKYGTPKTVIHVVTVKWKADSTPEQQQKAIDGIKEMAAAIPGIKNIWLRKLRVQTPAPEKPFDTVFAIEFVDKAAEEAYAKHPKHDEWYKLYMPIREYSNSHQITN